MKTDIQIAQDAEMFHIKEVAASYGIAEDDLELYGKYKAKLSDELIEKTKSNPDVARALLWHKRRRCRGRLCAGSTDGGFEPAFYRRFPCHHGGE